jgi:hypothetical protein
VSEPHHGGSTLTLIVAGEDQPKAVSGIDAAGIGNERNPVVHRFSDGYRLGLSAGEDWRSGMTRLVVNPPKRGSEESLSDIDHGFVGCNILKCEDPGGVEGRGLGIEYDLHVADHVPSTVKGIGGPDEE